MVEESEFGKGFAYCIGLFLCHDERMTEYQKMESKMSLTNLPGLWMNAAADHLFELEIPDSLPDDKKVEIKEWRSNCLHWRLEECSWEDVKSAIQFGKDTLRYWDEFNKIPSVKGSWE